MQTHVPLIPGYYYHIYNRGNNRDNIFVEERNYEFFLRQFIKYIYPVAQTYAYCLLRNHYHFLVRIRSEQNLRGFKNPEGLSTLSEKDIAQAFTNLFNSYAKAINRSFQRTGSLFERGFHRIRVTTEQHLLVLIYYIHHNSQKHGLVDDFRTYPHSSYKTLVSSKPTRLERDCVLNWFGGLEHFIEFHSAMNNWQQIDALTGEDDD